MAAKKIHPTSLKVIGNSEGGGEGGLKIQRFDSKRMKLNWNFQEGWGSIRSFWKKILIWEGYGYFLKHHNNICVQYVIITLLFFAFNCGTIIIYSWL